MAEVANPTELFSLPGTPRWVLGVIGWRASEFYALLSASEPRPQTVTPGAVQPQDPAELPATPLIAAGIGIKDRVMSFATLSRRAARPV